MANNIRWEHFPMTFYTTKFDETNFNLPKNWNKKIIIPEIEKDISENLEQNPNWNCNVKTNFNKKKNCLEKYKKVYIGLVYEFLHSLKIIDRRCKIIIPKIWYNIYYQGDYQESHTHWPDHFSFIHYVEYDPEVHSSTIFQNPSMYGTLFNSTQFEDRMFENTKTFNVEENSVVCFPSCVPHYVPRNESGKRRISVSFNANVIFD